MFQILHTPCHQIGIECISKVVAGRALPVIDADWINAFYTEVVNLMKAIRQLPE